MKTGCFSCLLVLLLGVLMPGCNSHKRLPSDYFCGEVVIDQDTARFYDCTTGRVYRMSHREAYAEVVQAYEAQEPTPMERIPMGCRGQLEQGRDSTEWILSVHSSIAFDRDRPCEQSSLLAGMYRSTEAAGQTLHLKGDYTYQFVRFTLTGEERESGRWGLSAALELVLNPTSPSLRQRRFEVIHDTGVLVANDGHGTLIFQPVYL